MTQKIELLIMQYEARLKNAMLQSDILELDKLLDYNLIFTNHLGKVMTKQNDLDAHESGMLKINQISVSEQEVKVYNDVVIVTLLATISGYFSGVDSNNQFRFTRVWIKTEDESWKVIVGHSSLVS